MEVQTKRKKKKRKRVKRKKVKVWRLTFLLTTKKCGYLASHFVGNLKNYEGGGL